MPALLRLVEVCVDGDLDATLTTAQEELAEAYLSTAEADKARVIAEDLLLRNPRSVTHRDRLRRVLVTLGEEDPEAVIAERLGFVQDDDEFGAGGDEEPESDELDELDAGQAEPPVSVQATAGEGAHGRDAAEAGTPAPEAREEAHRVRGGRLRGVAGARGGFVERDRQALARGAGARACGSGRARARGTGGARASRDGRSGAGARQRAVVAAGAALDATLPPGDHAARNFRVGQTYAAANMVKEAAEAFEKAARDPRYRFRSAQALARLFRKQQMLKEAVEWLDIAAEASAPSVDEHRAALYEWADALEATGETTRALVVLLDLVAEQGDYKDARARIDRLSRVQA